MKYFIDDKTNWQPGKRAKYMSTLTRKQSSLIFKARTMMIKVKSNYKNGFNDLNCRFCKNEEETQLHILEICPDLHPDYTTKVPNTSSLVRTLTLRAMANKLNDIMEKLSEIVY